MKALTAPLALLSLLFCNAVLAASPETCGVSADRLLPANPHPVFEFSQNKTIGTISRPLRSSGLLGLSATGELLWQTRQPLKSTIIIDDDGIRIFNRDDVLVNELNDAAIRQMTDILRQVFSGDSEALAGSFAAVLNCADDGGWQLELQPRDSELGELLRSVTVAGHGEIEALSFRETRGDMTELALTPVPESRLEELEHYLER